ncbi:hypothetical protein HK104_001116 [Borealophlyctis nickersoniae]|nr:hypothetical protein HK104_001116 [Borealophlyctis nickersoniae]
MSHLPKTTIHVTNISKDKAFLKRFFSQFTGFRRVSFHQDYCFVCFENLQTATRAIDEIHSQTVVVADTLQTDMLAAYAKHGAVSTATPTIVVQPNPILYISVFSYMTEAELSKIFASYQGYDSCRFFPSHALVRFRDVESAKLALEDLNATTNLFANYSTKGAKNTTIRLSRPTLACSSANVDADTAESSRRSDGGPAATSSTQPKRTIHVTNIDIDKASLIRLLSRYEGFVRIAFYADYCFVCFADPRFASKAIEEILFKTKMKANFAKADFIPHPLSPSAIGSPNAIIRVSDYPPNSTESDLMALYRMYEGFVDVQFYHASSLVYYRDIACAKRALEGLNGQTNMTAIYSRKGVFAKGKGGNPVSRAGSLKIRTPLKKIPQKSESLTAPASLSSGGDDSSSSPRETPSPAPLDHLDTRPSHDPSPSPYIMFMQPDMVAAAAVEPVERTEGLSERLEKDEPVSSIIESDGSGVTDSEHEADSLPPTDAHPSPKRLSQQTAVNNQQDFASALPSFFSQYPIYLQQQLQVVPQNKENYSSIGTSTPATQLPISSATVVPDSCLSTPFQSTAASAAARRHGLHSHHPEANKTATGSGNLEIEAQLAAAKTFIDELFSRLIVLQRENDALRQSSHCALSDRQHSQPPPSDEGDDWLHQGQLADSTNPRKQHHHCQAASSPLPDRPPLTTDVEALRRENTRLKKELEEHRRAYERLDAAHKQCGVLQGLLAMCE